MLVAELLSRNRGAAFALRVTVSIILSLVL